VRHARQPRRLRRAAARPPLAAHGRPDGLWAQLWAAAEPRPAALQKPLQDGGAAGEAVLHWLELLPPAELFQQLLSCAAAAAGGLLAAAPGAAGSACVRAALRGAAEAAALLLRRSGEAAGGPANPEEWLDVAGLLAGAEEAAARAEWLHRRIGAEAPRAVEALLEAAAADGGGGGGAEVEIGAGAELEALRARLPPAEPPSREEWLLRARAGGRAQRMQTTLEGGLAVVATALDVD